MAYSDLLSELLGIDKLRVMRTEIDSAEQITLFVESVEEVAVCPECKSVFKNSDQDTFFSNLQAKR